MSPRHTPCWVLAYQAVVYGLGILLAAGLIPQWGRWFSQSIHQRRQVEALLNGSLALSGDPSVITHDLVWSQAGVHQVWGLGIPAFRAVFESLARIWGADAFPDMLVMAVALGLAAWAVLRALSESEGIQNRVMPGEEIATSSALAISQPGGERETSHPSRLPLPRLAWFAGAAALLLLFPPFLNLLQSRFEVYEEVVAYEYLIGLGLIAGLLGVVQRTSGRAYLILCSLAGVAGFFRPPLMFHGAAVVAAGATALCWRPGTDLVKRWDVPTSIKRHPTFRCVQIVTMGVGIFVFGGALLFATNFARFGHGFEFGHKLNVQYLYGSLYATRFDHPFEDEPLLSAAMELFGWLFLDKQFNITNFYQEHIFPWQSSTVRWREAYLNTYDLSYLFWLAGGIAAGVIAWRKLCKTHEPRRALSVEQRLTLVAVASLVLYGVISSSFLVAFYLRTPVMASRYSLDFMPSFAAITLAGWLSWGRFCLRRPGGRWMLPLSVFLLAGWLGWQLTRSESAYGPPRVLTRKEMNQRKNHMVAPTNLPRSGFYASPTAPAETGIPYNGAGWQDTSGMVMPCVILFVDTPAFLEMELAGLTQEAASNGPVDLRAKCGLEDLRRSSISRSENGWVVRFSRPQRRQYQKGIQPVFLATVPKANLADLHTSWRLLKVRWRENEGGEEHEQAH